MSFTTPLFHYIALMSIGLFVGSFLNMLIYRLPRNMNWVVSRSMCPSCEHPLGVTDLVPLLSYCFSFGRCRHCRVKIPYRYVIVEILAALFLAVAYWQAPEFGWIFWKLAIFYMAGIAIFFIDLETYLIPNELTFGLVGFGLVSHFVHGQLWDSVLGMSVGYGLYWIIAATSKWFYKKDAMGGGDLKLGAAIGAMWGVPFAMISTYFSFLIGGIIGVFLLSFSRKKASDRVPFGPMIIAAAFIVCVAQAYIWSYLHTIFPF